MPRKTKAEERREHTERIALEVYHNRLLLGKAGDEHSDWAKAEKIVRSPIRKTLFEGNRLIIKLKQPTQKAFKFLAWDTPKWFLFSLPQLEWMKLLAVPLVIAAAGSIITGQIQREANQNAVLKAYFDKLEELTFEQNLLAETPNEGAIVLARGRTVAALRELDLLRRMQLIAFLQASDLSQIKEDIASPVISFKEQNLSGLDLRRVNLTGLDFRGAILVNANLEETVLVNANLEGASLWGANLRRARLIKANLKGASLHFTHLKGTFLTEANLEGVGLWGANLEGAVLTEANLEGADMGSDMEQANLERATLKFAKLQGVRNLNQDQLDQAKLCFTTLPQNITLDSNRDCKEMGVDSETGEWIRP